MSVSAGLLSAMKIKGKSNNESSQVHLDFYNNLKKYSGCANIISWVRRDKCWKRVGG
jgi:hypothetical protein